jgi:integrase
MGLGKAKKQLTDRSIAALKPAAQGKRDLHYDALVPGLAVRCTDTGAKSFVLVGRFPGSRNPTARAIGRVGAVTLLSARARAREWLAQLAAGVDPALAKGQRSALTFRAVAEEYQKRDGAALRTADERSSALARLVFPVIGDRPVADLRRSEIVALLDRVEDERGLVTRNRTLSLIRRILNWYASRSDDYVSPIAGVRGLARPEQARDRVLTDPELKALWSATLLPPSPFMLRFPLGETIPTPNVFGALVRFLLLTGARKGEATSLLWSEISDGVWTLPAAKNKTGETLVRPLSRAAQAVLATLPRIGDHVFTRSGTGPIGGLNECKKDLSYASGIDGWRLHDLRRTARTLLSRAGVPNDHAERCLGHVIGGVRGVYDRHSFRDEMLRAYEKLAELIADIVAQ